MSRRVLFMLAGAALAAGCTSHDQPLAVVDDAQWSVEMASDVPTVAAAAVIDGADTVVLEGAIHLWDVPLCDYTPEAAGIVATLSGDGVPVKPEETTCGSDLWAWVHTGDTAIPGGWIYLGDEAVTTPWT